MPALVHGVDVRRVALVALLLVVGCSDREEPCLVEYGNCEVSADCGAGAECGTLDWQYGEGQVCRRECEDELDCRGAGDSIPRCLDIGLRGSFYCYQSCGNDAQCPLDWVCQPVRVRGMVGGICLP